MAVIPMNDEFKQQQAANRQFLQGQVGLVWRLQDAGCMGPVELNSTGSRASM